MITYCCGPNAQKERFAKKWEYIANPLNTMITSPTQRVLTIAEKYIAEISLLPHITMPGNGDLLLEWETVKGTLTLHLYNNEEINDTLGYKTLAEYFDTVSPVFVQKLINE